MSVAQRIARRSVDAIFQRRDWRAIALLRVTPDALMRRDTIELLRELQGAYIAELEILPMVWVHDCVRAETFKGHTLARWLRRCGVALALEASLTTGTIEGDVISGWCLWDEEAFPDLLGQIQVAELLSIPTSASSVGWTVASYLRAYESQWSSTEFERKHSPGLRQFFLDLPRKRDGCATGAVQALPEMHFDDCGALGGIVLNFIWGSETAECRGESDRQWTVEFSEAKIMLNKVADAVTQAMITAATRTNRSIWRRL
ncbi:hypothetical protein [Paraburkholderia xenovorans]|uniref:hypothetical protein n=1 Tax=Paraburkholderia xenovorans TaxID=36873 RepID=UPI0038B79CA2